MKYKFYEVLPQEAVDIRQKVFVEEQGFENEFDDIDDRALHLVIFEGEQPVGCARMYEEHHEMILGRIAVFKEYRQLHLGSQILELLEAKAKSLGFKETVLSAQVRASEFYKKNGYIKFGEEYLDEYCPHINMKKVLS